MTTVTASTLDTLVRHTAGPCVSLVVPIDRRHPDDRQNSLELKHLIAEARGQLERMQFESIDALLEPAVAMLNRPAIAEHSGGLAVFLAPDFVEECTFDANVELLVTVGDRFTVGQLLPVVSGGHVCHVLTVGAEGVALFRLSGTTWTECDVPDLVTSMEEALWYERPERMSSSHSGGPVGAGAMSIIGHGSGAQDEDRKERLGRYLHKVDSAIVHYLRFDPDAPLVVAGTQPSVARYQQVSHHRNVVAAQVGSPGEVSVDELRRRVEEIIAPILARRDDAIIERFADRLGTGLAGNQLELLAEAASVGRVGDLIVGSVAPRWARSVHPLELIDEWEPDAIDIVNLIICDSLASGANVHCVDADRLPPGSPLAGVYRY